MKHYRLIASMAILLAVLFMFACTTSEDESFDSSFESDGTTKADFDGYELVYYLNPATYWGTSESADMYLGYDLDSNFCDLARARVSSIQKDYNCVVTIKHKQILHDYVKPIIMSGGYIADAVAGISDMWGDYARIGCFVGMNEVSDYIDITDEAKWGYKALVETMYVDDDLYGVVPMAWPDLVSLNFGYPIMFNGNIISILGQNDPREFYETHTWDYDRFFECLQNYTVEEGGETKYYGFLGTKNVIGEMFLYSDGAETVQMEGGEYSFGLHGYRGQEGMEAARRIVLGDLKYTYDKSCQAMGHVDICKRFLECRDVMATVYVGYLYGRDAIISTELDNYGVMPWPHGSHVSDDFTYGLIENVYTGIAMPVTGKDKDATAQILDLIYEPFEGYETYEKIVAYMTKSYFFDDRDADVFFSMFENCRYEYFHYMGQLPYLYLDTANKSIGEYIESQESEINELFETEVMRAVNGIVATHGSYFYDRENQ